LATDDNRDANLFRVSRLVRSLRTGIEIQRTIQHTWALPFSVVLTTAIFPERWIVRKEGIFSIRSSLHLIFIVAVLRFFPCSYDPMRLQGTLMALFLATLWSIISRDLFSQQY